MSLTPTLVLRMLRMLRFSDRRTQRLAWVPLPYQGGAPVWWWAVAGQPGLGLGPIKTRRASEQLDDHAQN